MGARHDIRIQLLGPLTVVRADGSEIPADAWRTGKTMDLLRLLALADGSPVRPESLTAKLWPEVPPDRARSSLRTASSQIRRTVGSRTAVVREREGLVLPGAWVDAVEYNRIASRAAAAAAAGRSARVVGLARVAERLYRGDFRAYDDESDWAHARREALRRTRFELLNDAAASALAVCQYREALRFARSSIGIDPCSEVAHRLLMKAHAASGEVSHALRVFESLRARLAAELGADPSPQTRELHVQLLRGQPA